MTLVLDGSTGVSLVQDGVVTAADLASGAITSAALPTGSVLQVVQATNSTNNAVTSTTYVDTAITASITPSSTSSKILVAGAVQVMIWHNGGAGADGYFRILNSTTSTSATPHYLQNYDYGGSGMIDDSPRACQWLDSPNSTSAQTYLIQVKRGSGDSIVLNNGGTSFLTLMEIAG
jgi:hypothetical protein